MKWIGILSVMFSAFCYGLAPIFVKSLYAQGVGVFMVIFLRFLVVCILLVGIVVSSTSKKEVWNISRKQIIGYIILGGAYLGVIGFYLGALRFLSVSLAVLLMYTYPLLVFLYNQFVLKIDFGKYAGFFVLVSLVGMGFLLGWDFSKISLVGVVLGLCSAICFAVYVVYSKMKVANASPQAIAFYSNIFSLIGILVGSLFLQKIDFNLSLLSWGYILLLGGLSTVVPYLMFLKGLNILGSTRSSVLAMLEPLFSIVFGILFLAESISRLQIFGGIILFGGSMALAFLPEKSSKKS